MGDLGELRHELKPPIIPPMTLRIHADGIEFETWNKKTTALRYDAITNVARQNLSEEMGGASGGGLVGGLVTSGWKNSIFSFAGPGGLIVLEGRFAGGHPKEIETCVNTALPLAVAKAKATLAGGGAFTFSKGSLTATTLSTEVPKFIGTKTVSIALDDVDFLANGAVVKKGAKKSFLGLPKTEFTVIAAKHDLVLQSLLQERGKLRLKTA